MKAVYKRAHTIPDTPETLFLQHVFAFLRIQTGTYRSLPPFSLSVSSSDLRRSPSPPKLTGTLQGGSPHLYPSLRRRREAFSLSPHSGVGVVGGLRGRALEERRRRLPVMKDGKARGRGGI